MTEKEFTDKLNSGTKQDIKELINEVTKDKVTVEDYFNNITKIKLTSKLIYKINEINDTDLRNYFLYKISSSKIEKINNSIIKQLFKNTEFNLTFIITLKPIIDVLKKDTIQIIKQDDFLHFFNYVKNIDKTKIDDLFFFLIQSSKTIKDTGNVKTIYQLFRHLQNNLDNNGKKIFFNSIVKSITKTSTKNDNSIDTKISEDLYTQIYDNVLQNFDFKVLEDKQIEELFKIIKPIFFDSKPNDKLSKGLFLSFYLENNKNIKKNNLTDIIRYRKYVDNKDYIGDKCYSDIINYPSFNEIEISEIENLIDLTNFASCDIEDFKKFIYHDQFKKLNKNYFDEIIDNKNIENLDAESIFNLQINKNFNFLSKEHIDKIIDRIDVLELNEQDGKNNAYFGTESIKEENENKTYTIIIQVLKSLHNLANVTEEQKIKILEIYKRHILKKDKNFQNSFCKLIEPILPKKIKWEKNSQQLQQPNLANDISSQNYNGKLKDNLESKVIDEILKEGQNNQSVIDNFKKKINDADFLPEPLIFAKLIDNNLLEKECILRNFLFLLNKINNIPDNELKQTDKNTIKQQLTKKIAISLKEPRFDKDLPESDLIKISQDLLSNAVSKHDNEIYKKDKNIIETEELKKIVFSKELNNKLMEQGFNAKTKIDLNDVYNILSKNKKNVAYYENYQYSKDTHSNRPLNKNDINKALKTVIDEGNNFIEDWKIKTKKIYDECVEKFNNKQTEELKEVYDILKESLDIISELLYNNSVECKNCIYDNKIGTLNNINAYKVKDIKDYFDDFNNNKKEFNKVINKIRKENQAELEKNKTINTKQKLINKTKESIKTKLNEIDNFIIENDIKSKEIDKLVEELKKNQNNFQEQLINKINIYDDDNEDSSLDEKLQILEQKVNDDIKQNNKDIKNIYDKIKKIHENDKQNKEIIKQAHYNDLNIQKNKPIEEEKELNKKIEDKQKEIIDLKKDSINMAQDIKDPEQFFNTKNIIINILGGLISLGGPIVAIITANPLFCLTALIIIPLIVYDVAEKNNIDKENEINALKKQSQNIDILNSKNKKNEQKQKQQGQQEQQKKENQELGQYKNQNKNINNDVNYNQNNINNQNNIQNNI